MPRKAKEDEGTLIEDQVIEAFRLTTSTERELIAKLWCQNYQADLSEYTQRTQLPPIALIISSLIETENELLVSPGRGVMYGAIGCWVLVAAVAITGVKIGTPECEEVIRKFPLAKKPKQIPVKKKASKVVPVAC